MLEWFKKEDSAVEPTAERTNNVAGTDEDEMIAVLFNKKIRRGISKVPATIGKNPNAADISFFHNSVDNVHCTIDCYNGQFTITDNGSREGTKINGQKIEPNVAYYLNNDDRIVLGKVEFEFVINYSELEKREMAGSSPAEAPETPREMTYTIKARPVLDIEYDEIEVVYISCGLEPEKKKAAYTQELKTEQIREALRAAEEKRAEEISVRSEEINQLRSFERPAFDPASFVPEADIEDSMLEKTVAMPAQEMKQLAEKPLSLTCIRGISVGEEILADHFPFKIGRSKANDYILKIDKISREHACITEKGGMYYITDTNSTNGIRVNGIKIDKAVEYRISEGDTITLSDNVYRVGFPAER